MRAGRLLAAGGLLVAALAPSDAAGHLFHKTYEPPENQMTRDTRLLTTKGLLLRNSMAVAGLIGTEQYYRTTADAVYYQSLFEDIVASIGGSVGAVIPYNASSLRLNNLPHPLPDFLSSGT